MRRRPATYRARSKTIDTAIYILIFCVIFGAALYLLWIFSKGGKRPDQPIPDIEIKEKGSLPCILCGSIMQKGDKLKSKEFKGTNDSIVHILGCSACHGDLATKAKTCPICKKNLQSDAYLFGKMWKTKKGKLHLHVNGCMYCRKSSEK